MNNNSKGNNSKSKKYTNQSFLESLKDIGSSTAKSFTKDVVKGGSEDFMRQLLGRQIPREYSGELKPGQEMVMDEVYTGEHEEKVKLQNQITYERRIHQEERIHVEKRQGELRVELHAIKQEIDKLAAKLPELDDQVKIAALQISEEDNPDIYHITFLESILKFIRSFSQKIENAALWMAEANKRSSKKRGNWVQNYKNQGAKYLLSGEHYLTRSAG